MHRWIASVVIIASLGLTACGSSDGGSPAAASTETERDALSGTVVVLAASSLTSAFGEIEAAFEFAHPSVDVALTFDGSAKLATAIIEGAPADVFASADEANLAKVTDAGLGKGSEVIFATNELQVVVAAGNPLGIRGMQDLTGDVVLSLCQVEVPCGSYATKAFEQAGLAVPAAGEEENVKGVLTRVQLGEADAGLVYLTDVLGAEGVEGVDLAADQRVSATYPAAVLTEAPNPEVAAAFLAFLTSADARAILQTYGFGLP